MGGNGKKSIVNTVRLYTYNLVLFIPCALYTLLYILMLNLITNPIH